MNHHDYLKNKPIHYRMIIYSVILLTLLNFYMNIWGYRYIAIFKSKSFNNIIEGCVYYNSEYNDKYGRRNLLLYINNKVYDLSEVFIKEFPFSKKGKYFYEQLKKDSSSCYKVKLIEIDIFFIKKIFIYDIN